MDEVVDLISILASIDARLYELPIYKYLNWDFATATSNLNGCKIDFDGNNIVSIEVGLGFESDWSSDYYESITSKLERYHKQITNAKGKLLMLGLLCGTYKSLKEQAFWRLKSLDRDNKVLYEARLWEIRDFSSIWEFIKTLPSLDLERLYHYSDESIEEKLLEAKQLLDLIGEKTILAQSIIEKIQSLLAEIDNKFPTSTVEDDLPF